MFTGTLSKHRPGPKQNLETCIWKVGQFLKRGFLLMVQESGDRNHLGCCNKTFVNNGMANYLHLNSWTLGFLNHRNPVSTPTIKPFASDRTVNHSDSTTDKWTRWDRGIHCRCLRNLCCWDFCSLCLAKAVVNAWGQANHLKNNRTQRHFEVKLIWKYILKNDSKTEKCCCVHVRSAQSLWTRKKSTSKALWLRFFPTKVLVNFGVRELTLLKFYDVLLVTFKSLTSQHCLENMDTIYIWKPSLQQRWTVVKLILHSGSGMNDEWIHGMNEWKFWDGCVFSVVHGANDHKHVVYTVCIFVCAIALLIESGSQTVSVHVPGHAHGSPNEPTTAVLVLGTDWQVPKISKTSWRPPLLSVLTIALHHSVLSGHEGNPWSFTGCKYLTSETSRNRSWNRQN